MTRLNLVENSIFYKINEVILIVATNMSADFRYFSQTCHFAVTGTKFVQLCEGISGAIESLEADPDFRYESVTLPIDTIVVDLSREDVDDDEFGVIENV